MRQKSGSTAPKLDFFHTQIFCNYIQPCSLLFPGKRRKAVYRHSLHRGVQTDARSLGLGGYQADLCQIDPDF
jgi:hypothetical protein